MNNKLLASISFMLVVSVSPSYTQQWLDRVAAAPPRASTAEKFAQLRGYSASGTHRCGPEKERRCIVTGAGFSNCNDASIVLQTRDCCPTTREGGTSSGFTLNYCIPDRSQ